MTELEFESDPKLELLTDALRAGPGTAPWRQALAALEHSPGADEYEILYAARERLASGRSYREVRAGPGFAHKVFEKIENEKRGGAKAWPAANLIAAGSALAIVGILALAAYFIGPRGGGSGEAELSAIYFVNPAVSTNFESDFGTELSPFGDLGLEAHNGLSPVMQNLGPDFRGGGLTWDDSLPPEQALAVEATLRLRRLSDDAAVQVFVTDDPNFTGESATSDHELVWVARGMEANVVLPGGRVAGNGVQLKEHSNASVRLIITRDRAAVDFNGQRIWEGANGLDSKRARTVGVRFLAREGAENRGRPSVLSIRLLMPEKK